MEQDWPDWIRRFRKHSDRIPSDVASEIICELFMIIAVLEPTAGIFIRERVSAVMDKYWKEDEGGEAKEEADRIN